MASRLIRIVLRVAFVGAVLALVAFSILRVQTTEIPVAATNLRAGQVIEAGHLRMKTVPLDGIYAGQYSDARQIVGRTLLVGIPADSPILTTVLAEEGDRPNREFPGMTAEDEGKLIVFVKTDLVSSSGNVVRAGDYVNVLHVSYNRCRGSLFLERVRVVGARNADGNEVTPVAQGASAKDPSQRIAGYLLAVTPEQSVLLAGLPADQLRLIYTTADAPPLSQLPVEVDMGSTGIPCNPR